MHCPNLERTLVKEKNRSIIAFLGISAKNFQRTFTQISVYLSNFTYRFYADAKFVGA